MIATTLLFKMIKALVLGFMFDLGRYVDEERIQELRRVLSVLPRRA